jgi:hypothetical protein
MPSRFRTSFTQVAGHEAAKIVQGRVMNVNLVKWTVDVAAQFDRHKYFNIQVGSPYLHHANGEGIYVIPEIGCKAVVCIPSDSTPPFVIGFVMANEMVNDSSADAPQGTTSHSQATPNPTDASFAGGRPVAKLGDIWMRTRDGNFVILHRGGVLQIGATELAQRIYLPLNNSVMDISENYAHHNTGGSITWGLQDGPSLSKFPTQHQQTFRIFADDKYADIRVSSGKVYSPLGDPDNGAAASAAGVGQSSDSPVICEVAVSPQGFIAESGEAVDASTVTNSVLRFVFDRSGNTLLRVEGNLYFKLDKKLTFDVQGSISVSTADAASFKAVNGFDIDGGQYVALKGSVIRLKEGQTPVGRIGDTVNTGLVAAPVKIQFSASPTAGVPLDATITTTADFIGKISSGNNNVLA